MWKKIHSNRNPQDTLYSELRREFGRYFRAAEQNFRNVVCKKPIWSFAVMMILLTGSIVLSFTGSRPQATERQTSTASSTGVHEEFRQLVNTTAKLRKTIRLKILIDSLSATTHLSSADSARLTQALDSLAPLQHTLTHTPHEH